MRVGEDRTTEKVIAVHSFVGDQTRIKMQVEGREFSVLGVANGILPLGGPEIIELLSEQATPDFEHLAADTPQKFYDAVCRLVKERKPFYTVLRYGWSTPAVLWEAAEPI